MGETILAGRIMEYREQNDMSQGEFGKLLNVSAQAVSRWEHGGMPDVALLPRIAGILGCSVDDLYAIASSGCDSVSAEEMLTQELRSTPANQRFRRANQLAWHLMKLNGSTIPGSSTDTVYSAASACEDADRETPDGHNNYPTNCVFTLQEGLMFASVSAGFKYTLLMEEPEEGFASILDGLDSYRQLFALFARENYLAIFLLGLSLPPSMQFTTDYVCKRLGLSFQQAQEALADLCSAGLLMHSSIRSADSNVDTYLLQAKLPVIPFLYFSALLRQGEEAPVLTSSYREEPWFGSGRQEIGRQPSPEQRRRIGRSSHRRRAAPEEGL